MSDIKRRLNPDSEPVSYAEQVYQEEHARPLFDVTVSKVVGTVMSGGTMDPLVAAMEIIGQFLAQQDVAPEGTFQFPTEDGLTVSVNITTKDPNSL